MQSETKHGEMRWAVVQFLKELFKKMDGYYLKFVHFVVLYSLFKLKFSLI